jgi:hypothetical protein
MGTDTSSLGAMRPGCEADRLPQCGAGVKNEWSYISIPHMPLWSAYVTMLVTGIFLAVSVVRNIWDFSVVDNIQYYGTTVY